MYLTQIFLSIKRSLRYYLPPTQNVIWFIACNISLSLSHLSISVISVQNVRQDTITNLKMLGDDLSPTNHIPDARNHPINIIRMRTSNDKNSWIPRLKGIPQG